MTQTTPLTTKTAAAPCPHCGFVVAVEGNVHSTTCPNCATAVALTWVAGTYKDGVPCDDRCQYAVGPRCSCSCGGDNHRRGYIHVDLVPAFIRQRDADRHAAKLARAAAKAADKKAARIANRDALIVDHPLLADLLTDAYAAEEEDGFVYDMVRALADGEMTDRQIAGAERVVSYRRQRTIDEARREQEAAATIAAGVRCPAGRLTFTGTIVHTKMEQDRFSYHDRAITKVLIETAEGWKVWGTMPRTLLDQNPYDYATHGENGGWLRSFHGRQVTMTAEIKPQDDPLFGYMSRPTKATLAPVAA